MGRRLVAWSLWLATIGICAAAIVVALVVTRPFALDIMTGAAFGLAFPLAYATIGLVLALRRPANPIGWLSAAAGLIWSLTLPFEPWVDQLFRTHRPLPWPPRSPSWSRISTGRRRSLWASPCRRCWCPMGSCGGGAGGSSPAPA